MAAADHRTDAILPETRQKYKDVHPRGRGNPLRAERGQHVLHRQQPAASSKLKRLAGTPRRSSPGGLRLDGAAWRMLRRRRSTRSSEQTDHQGSSCPPSGSDDRRRHLRHHLRASAGPRPPGAAECSIRSNIHDKSAIAGHFDAGQFCVEVGRRGRPQRGTSTRWNTGADT